MEHIVQFGINLDDEAIKNAVVKKATDAIYKKLEKETLDRLFYTNHRGEVTSPTSQFNDRILEWMDNNRDVIIDAIVDRVTERVMHSNKIKAAIVDKLGK